MKRFSKSVIYTVSGLNKSRYYSNKVHNTIGSKQLLINCLDQEKISQDLINGSITRRSYHATRCAENTLILGGVTVLTVAVTAQYAVNYYNSLPKKREVRAEDGDNKDKDGKEEPFYASWFAKRFYEGGFEQKMTKREAALVLGVRESSNADRIKEAHRRILLLNHPDRGGSAYMAAKINEAKTLMMKGK